MEKCLKSSVSVEDIKNDPIVKIGGLAALLQSHMKKDKTFVQKLSGKKRKNSEVSKKGEADESSYDGKAKPKSKRQRALSNVSNVSRVSTRSKTKENGNGKKSRKYSEEWKSPAPIDAPSSYVQPT